MGRRDVFATRVWCAAIGMAVASFSSAAAAPDHVSQAAPKDVSRADPPSAQVVAEAARDVMDALKERRRAGEPLTPTFVLQVAEWSRRTCLAEFDATREKAARVKAAESHLSTVTGLRDAIEASERDETPRVLYAQVKFFVAEARLWAANEKADKPARRSPE